jgi:hypothetical protein
MSDDDFPAPIIEIETPDILGWIRNPALDQDGAQCWMDGSGKMHLLRKGEGVAILINGAKAMTRRQDNREGEK